MKLCIARYLLTFTELAQLPRVTLTLSGDDEARRHFLYFTKRHPKYLFIRNKEWGVGLLRLPESFEQYLKGRDKQAVRTNRNRALSLGFRYARFSPVDHITDIMEVNRSAANRQGRPMHMDYLNEEAVLEFFNGKGQVHGVFDKTGRLRAYAHAPVFGEVCVFSRLLGHADDLDVGIMYLLISEVIREMGEARNREGHPTWGMYDTFFGAPSGLRYFKQRLGFAPYRVKWWWKPR